MQIPGLKICQRLGQGRTGTVHLAEQASPERTLAVKFLHPDLTGQPDFPARLRQTLRRLAGLHHPGLVAIHDIAVPGEQLYVVMEYLPGGSLAQRLAEGLFLGEALNLIRDLSRALAVAHRQGVVHGCLTPGNVLFRMDGAPVLTDFGVCPEPARAPSVEDDLRQLGELFRQLLAGRADQGEVLPLPENLARFRPLLARLGAAGGPDGYRRVEDFQADWERLLRPPGSATPAPVDPAPKEPEVATVPLQPAAAVPAPVLQPAAPLDTLPLPAREPARSLPVVVPADRPPRGRRKALAAVVLLPLLTTAAVGGWLLTRQPVVPASAAAVGSVPVEEAQLPLPELPQPAPEPSATPTQPLPAPAPVVGDGGKSAPEAEAAAVAPERVDLAADEPADEETLAVFEPEAVEEERPAEPATGTNPMAALAEEISRGMALAAVIPPAAPPGAEDPAVEDSRARRIDRLRARFETLLGDWQLTSGRNGHALGVLGDIRQLDPHHPFLAEGRRRIAVAYANLARAALDRGELKYARRWIERGERIQGLPLFADLRRELDGRYRILSDLTGSDPRPAPRTPRPPQPEPAGPWDDPPGIHGGDTPFGWQSR